MTETATVTVDFKKEFERFAAELVGVFGLLVSLIDG